jgi:hypothetical protein
MHERPSDVPQRGSEGVPAELPADYQAFKRAYRWPLLYGPWALGLIGLVMIGVGLFVDRPGPVAVTSTGFGAAMIIAGVLLPRMQGQLELGPGGVKGAVHPLPTAFMVATVTALEVAEETIPADEPDRDRKVDEAVGRVASQWMSLKQLQEYVLSPTSVRWAGEDLLPLLSSKGEWTQEDQKDLFDWLRARRQEEPRRTRPRDADDGRPTSAK